jgi:cytoskeletal protein CcmA (bactofilin family)
MNENNGPRGGKQTLVEEGTEFAGKLTSKCPIVVMGKVEGDVSGPVIHVTASGVVAGNVKVKELRSEGELAGEVEAEAVHVAGRVRDKTVIRARTLHVSLQSQDKGMEVVFGECTLAIGEEPNKAAAIAAATQEPAKAEVVKAEVAKVDAGKRRGSGDPTWEETTSPTPRQEPEEDGTRRKRGTQPPPA